VFDADMPFNAIYFPSYTFCKEFLLSQQERTCATPWDFLLAGTLAGIPAAMLTTPTDVIKTRLQVIPRPGEDSYQSIRDCFVKVYRKEGLSAFYQGMTVRTMRVAPQLGISVLAYEQLAQWTGLHSSQTRIAPTNVFADPHHYPQVQSNLLLSSSSSPK
jgi:solute carrier family 25 (mitochondrial aspartate/glutamate transporter), member 12/13